jgi:FHS family L-fucose permease-like MFS transporter
VQWLFAFLAAVLAAVAVVTVFAKNVDVDAAFNTAAPPGSVLSNRRLLFGFLTITICLGVEAGQFGFFRNFVEEPAIAGVSANVSEQLFTVYFAVFAAGRLIASRVQRKISPEKHVVINMIGAAVFLALSLVSHGAAAIAAVTILGFFTSILFPTLYAIAIENMGPMTGRASGLLTMGFIGCAFIPVLQGRMADAAGLQNSYAIGFTAYGLAAIYAIYASRTRSA